MHQVARQNRGKITHQSCANFPFKLCVRVSVIANCVPCLGVNEERMPWSSLPSCWKALTILAQPGNCNPAAQYLRVPGWTATQKGMIWRLRIVFHGHGGVITAIQIWVPPNNRMHSKIDPRHNPMRSHLGDEEPKIFHPPSAFHSTNDGYMILSCFSAEFHKKQIVWHAGWRQPLDGLDMVRLGDRHRYAMQSGHHYPSAFASARRHSLPTCSRKYHHGAQVIGFLSVDAPLGLFCKLAKRECRIRFESVQCISFPSMDMGPSLALELGWKRLI